MRLTPGLLLCLLLACAARAADTLAPPRLLSFQVEPPASLLPAVAAPETLGLDGVVWRSGYAALPDGRPLEILGRGMYGAAFVHPADPARMVKVAEDGFGRAVARSRARLDADVIDEALATRALAEAGAGPRLLAVTRIPHRLQPLLDRLAGWLGRQAPDLSRPALVKERVVGETIGQLRRGGRFTREHARMVSGLTGRIAAAGLQATDLHNENIMIGSTQSQPEPRAHLVDAGFVRSR